MCWNEAYFLKNAFICNKIAISVVSILWLLFSTLLIILKNLFCQSQKYYCSLERLRLTTSTANVYGKATRTRNRRRFLVKIVRATCRPYGVL